MTLPAMTVHGGRLDAAAARFPDAERPWLDLSTGINPVPYPIAALGIADPCPLPMMSDLAALERAAADAFGMVAGAIAALPGTEIGLRLLGTVGLPEPLHIVVPSYGTYAAAMPGAVAIAWDDVSRLARSGAGTVVLANPNNPDGRLIPPAELIATARLIGRNGGRMVIDEAFADSDPASSVLPLLAADDPVLVFRSFGKFYGLAGVRLGFVCAPEPMVARFRQRLGDWPVCWAAIAIGRAAYGDHAWQIDTRRRLTIAAGELDAVLRRHGFDPRGGCPLFRLMETPNAQDVFDRLGRAGILVRPFDYAPDWLRFGLPRDAAALDRLDRALGYR